MKKCAALQALLVVSVFILSGCVVRTYSLTRDRVDQNTTGGNQGYLQGSTYQAQNKEKETTRTVQVVEMEIRSPIRIEKKEKKAAQPKPAPAVTQEGISLKEEPVQGNKGYITQGGLSEAVVPEAPVAITSTKYTVQSGDTLQKISQKLYGSTKKWMKIYEANKDTLKSPDKIRAGQVLNIPQLSEPKKSSEVLKEPKANLK